MVAQRITQAMVDTAFRKTSTSAPQAGRDFLQGEFVVYPTHGVGRIEWIGVEELGGYRVSTIRVFFAETLLTIRIPAAMLSTTGLRKLANANDLEAALAILRERPRVSKAIWQKRAEEYRLKINSGELPTLAGVVRDLQELPGRNASYSQRNLYTLAIERMAEEFAAVQGIDRIQALEKLEQVLRDSVRQLEEASS